VYHYFNVFDSKNVDFSAFTRKEVNSSNSTEGVHGEVLSQLLNSAVQNRDCLTWLKSKISDVIARSILDEAIS
jgi:hypothetical protein